MTEEEARIAVRQAAGSEGYGRLETLATIVADENKCQNLISPGTVEKIWSRHILDSLQLAPLAPSSAGIWLDIGSGGGFPGLVVAAVRDRETILVEPRRRRAEFLTTAADILGFEHVSVQQCKVEATSVRAGVISARAVAPVEKLLRAAAHCATTDTRWLLPRGRLTCGEIEALQAEWKGVFHVEHSVTDSESRILVIDGAIRR